MRLVCYFCGCVWLWLCCGLLGGGVGDGCEEGDCGDG